MGKYQGGKMFPHDVKGIRVQDATPWAFPIFEGLAPYWVASLPDEAKQ